MTKAEENKDGIADAIKAMWEACQKEDWDAAADEFATAQSLADDDSGEGCQCDCPECKDGNCNECSCSGCKCPGCSHAEKDGKGKGLVMAIFGKPKK